KKVDEDPSKGSECKDQEKEDNVNNTNNVNAASTNGVNTIGANTNNELLVDPDMPTLKDISTFNFSNLRWIEAIQEELLHFRLQEVWTLVDLPNEKRAIGTKWVFWNKNDERGIMIRNKARLVSQGHTKEEGIDNDELFACVAKTEAIKLFLAYASFKNFMVYQMDVKSAFLYEKIKEEVYVCQPPGFEDLDFPDKVYKVEKALYRLHQASRVQVYVDDIIFGSTKKELCIAFEKMMHEKFK
nr:retrovirus-related Pol polyprotein from transposon TNT 1-94 [Tanacetum cinerariifolium]